MKPWTWLRWRWLHTRGWHYTGYGNTKCVFCSWELVRDKAFWESRFDEVLDKNNNVHRD